VVAAARRLAMMKALFINSGFLGHRSVARLIRLAVGHLDDVEPQYVDLSEALTPRDRVLRRLFSLRLAPSRGAAANVDLRRWREEMNIGLLARRRIDGLEQGMPAFDVFHFHTQAAAYASLSRMRRTPSIVSIDATQRLASLEIPGPLARLSYGPNIAHDGYVFRAARAIVSTSQWAARDLASIYPDCAGKVRVLPYPVDLSAFDASWMAERAQRAARVPRALFIGGDFPRKGGFDLLDVWRDGAFGRRAQLDIVTDFPLRRDLLPEGVRVMSGVPSYSAAWREAWRDADLFVMPTRHEAFGMVFQEAAASGLPAIGTNINAIPELIEDDVTGRLVQPGDRASLTAALDDLISRPDRRQQFGRAARRRIERIGAPSTYAHALRDLLGALVEHRELQPA
jgi:glycosyltransferase involved in cell wall biosynthesis